jgi:molybdopterin-biosynthesis enzyme MoeA-like protein
MADPATHSSEHFGIIVVGDEILSGRRRDRHFDNLGELLRSRGFSVAWLRILPDDPDYLASELAHSMAEGIPVFCCGGIGATPDDHTRQCAARAAGQSLIRHPGAVAEIEAQFGAEAYPNRVRMAELPADCELIPNPHNRIPGFSLRQHYFLPGFPDMALPMASWVLDTYYAAGGHGEQQRAVWAYGVPESGLLDLLDDLNTRFPDAHLFSLPRMGDDPHIEIGFRGSGDIDTPFRALMDELQARAIRYDIQAG